jgi:hypothetical protein
MKNNKNKKQDISIKDGDSRPDKQDHGKQNASNPVAGKNQKKFSTERGADVNGADDFRDAK